MRSMIFFSKSITISSARTESALLFSAIHTRLTLNETRTLLGLASIKSIVWHLHGAVTGADVDVDVVVDVVAT